MKKQIRILGIDDSPFSFNDKYSTVIGAIMRGGEYLECVLSRQISVDGTDATDTCIGTFTIGLNGSLEVITRL